MLIAEIKLTSSVSAWMKSSGLVSGLLLGELTVPGGEAGEVTGAPPAAPAGASAAAAGDFGDFAGDFGEDILSFS